MTLEARISSNMLSENWINIITRVRLENIISLIK